jgi:predicted metal-dependent hydrolase
MIQSQHHYNRYQRFIGSLRGQSVDGYAEVHHIVPRSLGGSDDADNLIRLTARQHFIAHWILARALGGSASRAFFMMSNFGKYGQVNSTTYQIARQEYAALAAVQMAGRVMPPVSEETRKKQSQAKLGKKLSAEHVEKVRLAVLDRWYRKQLREAAEPLLAKWESKIGVKAEFWGVKRMKTKWGSCNHETSRVWLNSELAKKPIECLEYIVVHELIHLIEPSHDDNFVKLLDKYLPNWQSLRDILNSTPLAHEDWHY